MVDQEIYLSRRVDKFVPPIRWIASLSNGETIFEDNKPGELSAWTRLAEYVKLNKLSITRLRFQMNELEVPLPAGAVGYVQKKKMISMGGFCQKQHCIGHIGEDGRALLHYVSDDHSSYSEIVNDPGPPFTIYSHETTCERKCCHATTNSQ